MIQTVGGSSDSSCLIPDVSSTGSFFTFDPPVPLQCTHQMVAWNTTRYNEPPEIRAFIPGGEGWSLRRETSISATGHSWEVNIRDGTQFVLLIQPIDLSQRDGKSRTSPLMTVTGKSNDIQDCLLISGEHKSTVILDSTATATPTVIGSSTEPNTGPTTVVPEASKQAENTK